MTSLRALRSALCASLASALVAMACGGDDDAPVDAGPPDVGPVDAGLDAPPLPSGPAKRVFAKRYVVPVYTGADREGPRLGYIRAGATVRATTAEIVAEGGRCRQGWYELAGTGGFVCNERDVTVFDGRRLPSRPPAQPDREASLPYRYGRTRRDNVAMYSRLPTDEDAALYEGYRIPGVAPIEGVPGDGESGAAGDAPGEGEGGGEGGGGGGGGETAAPEPAAPPAPEPAPPPIVEEGIMPASGEVAMAAAEGDPLLPETAITLAELEGEEGGVLRRRMIRGFIVSLDRDMRASARRYWRTLSNGFIPYFSVGLVEGSEFHGDILARPAGSPAPSPGAAAPAPPPPSGSDTSDDSAPRSADDDDDPRVLVLRETAERAATIRASIEARYRPVAERPSLPMGWVTSSKTFEYTRGRDGHPRRGRRDRYHLGFSIIAEEVHRDVPFVVAGTGELYRTEDVSIARAVSERPDGVGEAERWIDVDLEHQTLVAYEGLVPVFATLVASGRVRDPEDPRGTFDTPHGLFRITSKHITHTMDGDHAVDGPYSIEDVPYVMYFQLAFALHSAFWHNSFGHPRSHGCVNLAPDDARWLFEWAGPTLPAGWHVIFPTEADPGTWVHIHGATPE